MRPISLPPYMFWALVATSILLFVRSLWRRFQVLKQAQADPRFQELGRRFKSLIIDGVFQSRQPRYLFSGIMHLLIFWGFVVLGLRSIQLLFYGMGIPLLNPFENNQSFWFLYGYLRDTFEIIVLIACVILILRRAILRPGRYKGSNQIEAYLVLGLISFLMITDIILEMSYSLFTSSQNSLTGYLSSTLFPKTISKNLLNFIINTSFLLHILTFLFFLNLLPISKHFHIITALPNVFFRKIIKSAVKPVRYGVSDIENLEYLGTKYITDLTWKHILDIYTCTECGRCSDNCPANLSGRKLSPKLLTLKLRDCLYKTFPIFGNAIEKRDTIPGGVIDYEEIWSCTTCAACEEECPVFIEYIDKIVDMRRYLIEQGEGPASFNQVFMHLEKTGNPFGKPPAKRSEWTKELEGVPLRVLKKGESVATLLFVDSYPSFDPKAIEVAASVAKGLYLLGEDFGILGPLERDSGHQVRRMGEEGLFELLKEQNLKTFEGVGFERIVTVDPHSFNALKKEYGLNKPVFHYAEYFYIALKEGKLKLKDKINEGRFTYHDPCYLGRHNNIYEPPRELLKQLLYTPLIEMKRNRDRSFCCGGADVGLWHEVKEEERMAFKRVKMAVEAGADHIVVACPFCLIHIDDAIKTMGLEGKMKVVDLMHLITSVLQEA